MRRKITALMMAAAVVCTSLIACGTAKTAYADETIYGEVTATTDNGFTITVGTYEDGELALGDETADIVVADDTTYSMSMSGGQQPGEAPGEAPSGEAPEKSEGEAPSGEAPEQPEGEAPADMGNPMEVSLSSISVGAQVAVTFDADGNVESVEILGGMQSAMGMPGATSAADIVYTALYEYSEDATVDGETIASTGTDESAILVTDGEVTVSNSTITRESDDSTGGDNSSFYGVGATLLTTGGTLTVENCEISSDAAGGGTVYATNNTVTTNGASSAAIRSDRGGGTMVVDGGTYTSNGTGSPAVYCTADITISDATLTATNSEAVCIEGLNSLTLTNCDLSGSMPENEQNDCDWNIILYQSMSGDSEVGNSTFKMTGGSITATNGGMFYTTNTESTFILENVDITYANENDFFLKATGNANQRGWGTSGDNGAQCTFTAINQKMEGDVIWDTISTLDMEMTNGSVLTGAFIDDESAAGNGGDGYANLIIDSSSKWIVTGDSVLTTLTNNGTIVDANGNTVSIVGTDGTVYVQGTSSYTITVDLYIS